MQQRKELSPDYIRDIAVSLLHNNYSEEGVKQSDLWREVETFLIDSDYNVTQHTLKNALWDLEKQRPSDVLKIKHSPKNVELYPIINQFDEEQDYEEQLEESQYDRATGSLRNLSGMLFSVTRDINYSGIHAQIAAIEALYIDEYSPAEIEAIFTLKTALEFMEKSQKSFKAIKGRWNIDSRLIFPE